MNDVKPVEILLVEDNPRDAELILRALKKHDLADRVFHVTDGADALDFIFTRGKYKEVKMERPLKVILLDLKLPKVSGLEVLRAIKTDEQTQTIPVVIVTSSSEDPDMQTAYELGANSYIVKPVQFDAFIDAMTRLGTYWLRVNHPPVGG